MSVDLPEPETPVMQQSRLSGNVEVDAAKVVDTRSGESEVLAAGLTAHALGTGMKERPER